MNNLPPNRHQIRGGTDAMSGSPLLPPGKCEIWGVLFECGGVESRHAQGRNRGNHATRTIAQEQRENTLGPSCCDKMSMSVRCWGRRASRSSARPALNNLSTWRVTNVDVRGNADWVAPRLAGSNPAVLSTMAVSSLAQSTGCLEACEVDSRPATTFNDSYVRAQSGHYRLCERHIGSNEPDGRRFLLVCHQFPLPSLLKSSSSEALHKQSLLGGGESL